MQPHNAQGTLNFMQHNPNQLSTDVYVFPSNRNPLTLEDSERLSRQIADTLATEVGLPLRHSGIEISSGTMLLQPEPGSDLYGLGKELLGSVSAEYIANVADHMQFDAGTPLEGSVSDGVLEIWIHISLAQEMGIQVGDQLIIRPYIKFIQPSIASATRVGTYAARITLSTGNDILAHYQLTALFGFVPIHDIWLKLRPGASEAVIRKTLPATVNVVAYTGQDTEKNASLCRHLSRSSQTNPCAI